MKSSISSLTDTIKELESEMASGRSQVSKVVLLLALVIASQFFLMYCCFELRVPQKEDTTVITNVRNVLVQTNLRAKKKQNKNDSPPPFESPLILSRVNSLPAVLPAQNLISLEQQTSGHLDHQLSYALEN